MFKKSVCLSFSKLQIFLIKIKYFLAIFLAKSRKLAILIFLAIFWLFFGYFLAMFET